MQWSSKQVEQKVRELENLAYRLGLDEGAGTQPLSASIDILLFTGGFTWSPDHGKDGSS